MENEDEKNSQLIEDYKELGHEYRYRDQLMVQEFNLAMVAIGVLINAAVVVTVPIGSIFIQAFGLAFLFTLSVHLTNINQDRIAILHNKNALREKLSFALTHQNVSGKLRWSAPRLMVWFTYGATFAWLIWLAISIYVAGSSVELHSA